ncbi:MAG: NAD(P)-dependent oxidoreductase [Candidatus Omnitrophota bacterium]
MKILITGATGFIGGRLVKRLLTENHDLFCLVRETSKVDFLKQPGVSLVMGDITDGGAVDRIFQEVKPEAVFHLAAKVLTDNEKELYAANVDGTRNICQACYNHEVSRLVYTSSVSVISGNLDVPLTEGLPYKASDSYGRSKIAAERIAVDFRGKGLPVAIVRPCMVYGEGEPHLLGKILKKANAWCLPVLNVQGMDSKLHLVYIENVIDVLAVVLEKNEALEGTFMVADKEVLTLRKFIEILYDKLNGTKPPVVPRWLAKTLLLIPSFKVKADRVFKDRVYDITRAVAVLGYVPKVSTEEGLTKTVKWWKEKLTCNQVSF